MSKGNYYRGEWVEKGSPKWREIIEREALNETTINAPTFYFTHTNTPPKERKAILDASTPLKTASIDDISIGDEFKTSELEEGWKMYLGSYKEQFAFLSKGKTIILRKSLCKSILIKDSGLIGIND